jgi:hypothetical protein
MIPARSAIAPLAAALLSLAPATAGPIESGHSPTVVSDLSIPLSAPAGMLGSGMLCLPKGRARLSDFVSSKSEFSRLVTDAFLEYASGAGSDHLSNVRVTLISIESKLCNKSYGMFGLGDKRAHSGKVSFGFDLVVRRASGSEIGVTKRIMLTIDKKSAQPIQAMLPLALKELFSQVRPSLSADSA